MNSKSFDKNEILKKAKEWFEEKVAKNHRKNSSKLKMAKNFDINPFSAIYLANFLTGNSSPESIARALLLPRVLGTSFNTSFGTQIQNFSSDVLGADGSTSHGIDIEFIDQVDKEKKYCQLKSGPNTINKDDVETIAGHFTKVINLSKTNNKKLGWDNLIVGIIWGEPSQLNSHYKRIEKEYHYPVFVGKDFWHRLTGEPEFYSELISAIGSVALEADYSKEFERWYQNWQSLRP